MQDQVVLIGVPESKKENTIDVVKRVLTIA